MTVEFPWTAEIEDAICAEISSGTSMRQICARKGMPSEPTLYRRMAVDDAFAAKMAVARAAQQDHEIEECLRIADDATPEDVQVAKLRISTRQWRAAKLAPKKYGDKVTNVLSDPDGKALDLAPRFIIQPAAAPAVIDDAANSD